MNMVMLNQNEVSMVSGGSRAQEIGTFVGGFVGLGIGNIVALSIYPHYPVTVGVGKKGVIHTNYLTAIFNFGIMLVCQQMGGGVGNFVGTVIWNLQNDREVRKGGK
jgi:hypothetical protein